MDFDSSLCRRSRGPGIIRFEGQETDFKFNCLSHLKKPRNNLGDSCANLAKFKGLSFPKILNVNIVLMYLSFIGAFQNPYYSWTVQINLTVLERLPGIIRGESTSW